MKMLVEFCWFELCFISYNCYHLLLLLVVVVVVVKVLFYFIILIL